MFIDRCSVAANSARDIGARLMVLTVWGLKAGGGSYAALAALTNIPATIVGILFYEFILADSSRGIFIDISFSAVRSDSFSSYNSKPRRLLIRALGTCRAPGTEDRAADGGRLSSILSKHRKAADRDHRECISSA